MCGIVGVVSADGSPDPSRVERMRDVLRHRGPDDAGIWAENGVVLGHRRLSVIDLSQEGHQPMVSADGRFVISYNGEIYNYRQLRQRLTGIDWRGNSDTEVLVEAAARWGVVSALSQSVGMFALAIYDRERRELWLARDRLGIKPLYFGWTSQGLVFASELSAIRAEYGHELEVDRDALALLLRHNYIPAPHTIFRGIQKLLPAATVRFRAGDIGSRTFPEMETYWSLSETRPNTRRSEPELLEELTAHMQEAVRCRMVADVPLGGFLSGGIDSSLVCALLQEASPQPIKTFTMGFEDPAFDEAPHARDIAQHLGCDHTEMTVTEGDMLSAVDRLSGVVDEPFADASLLPTLLLSTLARQHVTVALSGDGGDELFWGYTRYPAWERLKKNLLALPLAVRRPLAAALTHGLTEKITGSITTPAWIGRPRPMSDRIRTLCDLLRTDDERALYLRLISHWKRPDEIVIGSREPTTIYGDTRHWTSSLPPWRRVATQDLLMYLPNDILTKVDRASMATSLEVRVPFLDHRLVEFCHQLPESAVRRSGESKWLMRRVLEKHVPREMFERPKQGFGVPMDRWLRGPLKEWMLDLLSSATLEADGYLNPQPVAQRVDEHLQGVSDWGAHLWDVLMFQLWLKKC